MKKVYKNANEAIFDIANVRRKPGNIICGEITEMEF